MRNRKLSIGIFGGLFDPPHIGHLIICQHILEEFNLDKIIFVPAFNPPHKHLYSGYQHRYEMTRIAIAKNKGFSISNIEKHIRGKTYTYKVIRAIRKQQSYSDANFYLIVGADQWQEIEHWKRPDVIVKEAQIVVVPRYGYKIEKTIPYYDKILVSKAPFVEVSSTMIREKMKKGFSIDYLVVPDVLQYIKEKHLYV